MTICVTRWGSKRLAIIFSAYVPYLPGCVATGATVPEVETEIRDAIRFHIEGLRADGLDVPKGDSLAEYVERKAPAFSSWEEENDPLLRVGHHLPSAGPCPPGTLITVERVEVDAAPRPVRQVGAGTLPERPFAAG